MSADEAKVPASSGGYAKGRARREQIVTTAAEVYADVGYHGASLREIAKRAGISHVGLLYYFPNREALLAAVLERRDEEDTARIAAKVFSPRGAVQHLVDLADHNARHPGMVELYVRLAAEAVAATTVLTFLGTPPRRAGASAARGRSPTRTDRGRPG